MVLFDVFIKLYIQDTFNNKENLCLKENTSILFFQFRYLYYGIGQHLMCEMYIINN